MADLRKVHIDLENCRNAAALVGLGGVATVILLAGGPQRLWDYLKVQVECAGLHLRALGNTGSSLFRWPETQYHVWTLLSLEAKHRLENYSNKRLGITTYGAGVPHVDTANARRTQENAKKMMMEAERQPILKQLVLIGGGHTHAFVLKMFAMKPIPGVRLVLITRDVMTPYSGMLPGHVAGEYTRDECHIDLVKLGEFAGATLVHGEATGIDRRKKIVTISGGQPGIPYDVLSIDIGCTPMSGGLEVKVSSITPVKPIDGFAARWDRLLGRVMTSDSSRPFRIVVVGGGAGGVELACAMHQRIHKELDKLKKSSQHVKLTLATRGSCILSSHNKNVQKTFHSLLTKERGIDVLFNTEIVSAEEGKDGTKLVTKDGLKLSFEECIWCTTAGAATWLRETGLDLDRRGFIQTNDFLQSINDPDIFAAGDCASMKNHPRPKAGVFAVRAGPPLNANLRRRLADQELLAYEPQVSFLGLIGTGDPKRCIASKGTLCMDSDWLWGLKDWIDRKWMADYTTALADKKKKMMEGMTLDIPTVATGAEALAILKESQMRCGGCGSKVGGSILSKVMKRIRHSGLLLHREEVVVGLDAPDDCALVSLPTKPGMVMVHTVDFFKSFISDPYVFGMVAANHALSDCHAMGAETVSALAVAVVPYSTPSIMEDTLYRMMAGACVVLGESNCALVGGHTCEGAEMALGFSVNGVVDRKKAMTKGGMKEGDVLILTKPLGTGTLFAANMRCEAFGRDIKAALDNMCKSNKAAGEILILMGSQAATDVTGFGLLGHLHEMTEASKVGAALSLSSTPFLDGAEDCIRKGIFSSLHDDNHKISKSLFVDDAVRKMNKFALLFDPQTAGGLLASVPKAKAESCIKALKNAGYPKAAAIGTITARAGGIRVGV